ncbi:hypothetical protein AO242_27995 [Pseudomonas sp. ICMP 561]|nr:hypothetical protein AO242_27995 [Pseudomonas sp. ICMP 561]
MVSIILLFVIVDDEVDHGLQNLMQSFSSLWLTRQVLRRSAAVDVVTATVHNHLWWRYLWGGIRMISSNKHDSLS